MKWLPIVCVAICCFCFTPPVDAGQTPLENVIPQEMALRGWKAEDKPLLVSDEETLSMVINGAAPRYMALGTQRAAFVNYEKDGVYLMVEIFETESKTNSEKLFDEFSADAAVPLKNPGEKARLTAEMGGSVMLEYFQDRFYVRVSVMQKSDAAKKAAMACGEIISHRIAGSGGKKSKAHGE